MNSCGLEPRAGRFFLLPNSRRLNRDLHFELPDVLLLYTHGLDWYTKLFPSPHLPIRSLAWCPLAKETNIAGKSNCARKRGYPGLTLGCSSAYSPMGSADASFYDLSGLVADAIFR
jgi:hypothetical protein